MYGFDIPDCSLPAHRADNMISLFPNHKKDSQYLGEGKNEIPEDLQAFIAKYEVLILISFGTR